MSVILIVDDVEAMREQYAYDLRRLGGRARMRVEYTAYLPPFALRISDVVQRVG